ncbi:MAG: apolipoprotein A1/A4/E family protein [Kiritimatiellales bacterium]|nr:apolipoprotein A1/A4/E family protein [Kiritimatiellales bacterium]
MKKMPWSICVCTVLMAALFSGGCKKKEEPAPEPLPEPVTKTEVAKENVTKVKDDVTAKVKELDAVVKEKASSIKTSFMGEKADITADLGSSLTDVKAKAASLDQKSLMNYMEGYKTVIAEKTTEYQGLVDKVKGISKMELLGSKGRELTQQVAQYKDQLTALKDRYQVYIDKLKSMGVDLSKYGL